MLSAACQWRKTTALSRLGPKIGLDKILQNVDMAARWHNSIQSQSHKCTCTNCYYSKVFASVSVSRDDICVERSVPMTEYYPLGWVPRLDQT